ncbi:calcium and integrin-binding protein 1 isoform X3 [Lingula anatina]|uniref:Calcium and integrin-binding protein 1 isoform X3 n=1 Tax=Lingula anatina TaxID=7574 RepID=A0A1S3J206_LINAN|nr:calcium and integrin-binding protein 1 isoform X3 [Lingula anatina]|eukprot:XP_013404296.1 calcium and integrin-binding protein 1 isoform X3 [Lingula anatina]
MGGSDSKFDEQELEDYQELTYFTKKEILHVHKRFTQLAPDLVEVDKNATLPQDKIMMLPELRVNPFKDRICKVFSSSGDGSMSFEDFLDMMSVFSDNAPKNVKVEYAFRIYDFDEDDMISSNDLKEVIDRLTGEQRLGEEDMQQLIDNMFRAIDIDGDKKLSFPEFDHLVSKAPEFTNSFRIRL